MQKRLNVLVVQRDLFNLNQVKHHVANAHQDLINLATILQNVLHVLLELINLLLGKRHAFNVPRASIRLQARHNVQNVMPVLTEYQHELGARFALRVRFQH